MYIINENKSIDTRLITCAEYQLFIDEKKAIGEYIYPDHWHEKHFPAGTSRQPILGIRPTDAWSFCKWLSEKLGNDEYVYRPPTPVEAKNHPLILNEQLSLGYWVFSGPNKHELIWIGNRKPDTSFLYNNHAANLILRAYLLSKPFYKNTLVSSPISTNRSIVRGNSSELALFIDQLLDQVLDSRLAIKEIGNITKDLKIDFGTILEIVSEIENQRMVEVSQSHNVNNEGKILKKNIGIDNFENFSDYLGRDDYKAIILDLDIDKTKDLRQIINISLHQQIQLEEEQLQAIIDLITAESKKGYNTKINLELQKNVTLLFHHKIKSQEEFSQEVKLEWEKETLPFIQKLAYKESITKFVMTENSLFEYEKAIDSYLVDSLSPHNGFLDFVENIFSRITGHRKYPLEERKKSFDRARILARIFNRVRTRALDRRRQTNDLDLYIFISLTIARLALRSIIHTISLTNDISNCFGLVETFHSSLDLANNLSLLNERIAGRCPPLEGIRIVKERKL